MITKLDSGIYLIEVDEKEYVFMSNSRWGGSVYAKEESGDCYINLGATSPEEAEAIVKALHAGSLFIGSPYFDEEQLMSQYIYVNGMIYNIAESYVSGKTIWLLFSNEDDILDPKKGKFIGEYNAYSEALKEVLKKQDEEA